MRGMSHSVTTPRWDGATLRAAFTVNPEVPEGVRCSSCKEHVGPGKYHECWTMPASADTHPKDGDVEQAPLVSGAVAKPDAQTQSEQS